MTFARGTAIYGKERIAFDVQYVSRKTMEIAVHPDKTVVVKAPFGTEMSEIHRRVGRRAGWIKRQLEYFRQFDPRMTPRRFVGGESHLYLGRQYRLKIQSSSGRDDVKLLRGYIRINAEGGATSDRIKLLLESWYAEKASVHFRESFERNWKPFEKLQIPMPRLQIRRMRKRWGSLSPNGLLTLNTDLIRAPKECIDYVIVHELCHLQHHDHGAAFYRLLEKVDPHWVMRKTKLERALV